MKQLWHLAGIIFLDYMAGNAILIFLFFILLPKTWHGYQLAVPAWIMLTIMTGVFAYWYFRLYPPSPKDLVIAVVAWIVLPFTMSVIYSLFTMGDISYIVYSLETYVQYALQALAVGATGYLARRDHTSHLIGEGREI